MKTRQWTLVGALGLTLAATWWASQIEDDGVAEGDVAAVVAPATRAQRAPAAAQRPRAQAAAASSAELAIIRRTGTAFDREEHEPGIICVAAPILSAQGRVLGALSLTSSTNRNSLADLESRAGRVKSTAARIAQAAENWHFPDDTRQTRKAGAAT